MCSSPPCEGKPKFLQSLAKKSRPKETELPIVPHQHFHLPALEKTKKTRVGRGATDCNVIENRLNDDYKKKILFLQERAQKRAHKRAQKRARK